MRFSGDQPLPTLEMTLERRDYDAKGDVYSQPPGFKALARLEQRFTFICPETHPFNTTNAERIR
jgi:hypothetical protein